MDLSLIASEINGDFGRKSQIFPTAPPRKGLPLKLGTGAGGQNDGATEP